MYRFIFILSILLMAEIAVGNLHNRAMAAGPCDSSTSKCF